MDPKLFKLARQLQTKLSRIDDQADSDAFDSVHALLIEFIGCIENAIPGLKAQRLLAQAKVNREEATRLLKEMKLGRELPDERDIIEKIKRILGDEGPGTRSVCLRNESRVRRELASTMLRGARRARSRAAAAQILEHVRWQLGLPHPLTCGRFSFKIQKTSHWLPAGDFRFADCIRTRLHFGQRHLRFPW